MSVAASLAASQPGVAAACPDADPCRRLGRSCPGQQAPGWGCPPACVWVRAANKQATPAALRVRSFTHRCLLWCRDCAGLGRQRPPVRPVAAVCVLPGLARVQHRGAVTAGPPPVRGAPAHAVVGRRAAPGRSAATPLRVLCSTSGRCSCGASPSASPSVNSCPQSVGCRGERWWHGVTVRRADASCRACAGVFHETCELGGAVCQKGTPFRGQPPSTTHSHSHARCPFTTRPQNMARIAARRRRSRGSGATAVAGGNTRLEDQDAWAEVDADDMMGEAAFGNAPIPPLPPTLPDGDDKGAGVNVGARRAASSRRPARVHRRGAHRSLSPPAPAPAPKPHANPAVLRQARVDAAFDDELPQGKPRHPNSSQPRGSHKHGPTRGGKHAPAAAAGGGGTAPQQRPLADVLAAPSSGGTMQPFSAFLSRLQDNSPRHTTHSSPMLRKKLASARKAGSQLSLGGQQPGAGGAGSNPHNAWLYAAAAAATPPAAAAQRPSEPHLAPSRSASDARSDAIASVSDFGVSLTEDDPIDAVDGVESGSDGDAGGWPLTAPPLDATGRTQHAATGTNAGPAAASAAAAAAAPPASAPAQALAPAAAPKTAAVTPHRTPRRAAGLEALLSPAAPATMLTPGTPVQGTADDGPHSTVEDCGHGGASAVGGSAPSLTPVSSDTDRNPWLSHFTADGSGAAACPFASGGRGAGALALGASATPGVPVSELLPAFAPQDVDGTGDPTSPDRRRRTVRRGGARASGPISQAVFRVDNQLQKDKTWLQHDHSLPGTMVPLNRPGAVELTVGDLVPCGGHLLSVCTVAASRAAPPSSDTPGAALAAALAASPMLKAPWLPTGADVKVSFLPDTVAELTLQPGVAVVVYAPWFLLRMQQLGTIDAGSGDADVLRHVLDNSVVVCTELAQRMPSPLST